MTDSITLPPLPDTATVAQVAGLVRHILTTLAGMGIMAGFTISDSNLMIFCSAGVWLGTIVWSLWQKFEAHRTLKTVASSATPKGTASNA